MLRHLARSSNEGALRYNSTAKAMEFCNGTSWQLVNSLGYVGGAKMLGAANCEWATTSLTWVKFNTDDAQCNTLTVDGTATTPSEGKIPGIKFSSLPSGRYKVTYTIQMADFTANSRGCMFRITDGTSASAPIMTDYNAAIWAYTLIGDFEYATDQSNVTFLVESRRVSSGTTGGGDCTVMVDGTDYDMRIVVEKIK
ncbi:MAG: hypothetical protein HC883_02275 [Bdellovibrionaceae bacterium]|nr:hypothetical protein [Pseudobdellovibrionaceae bacterium]